MTTQSRYPYQLKLYDPNDSDFTVHCRFNDPLFPEDDLIVSTCQGYLCFTSWAIKPDPRGKYLIGQFEFSLPYLKWLLGVIARFKLTPDQGGYPPGTMYDIVQLDKENEVYVFRGAHHGNHGLMRYRLENRKRRSYVNPIVQQEFELYDVYLDTHGLMQVLLDIQRQYEDGQI
ncbi:MAG: hypothetical protein ABJ000_00600 [Saccharospirillum sp.]|uniref:hypothetical protein n=1 Tax=Saccharospirillum sp. TaxID=2033801 RepID=UPI003297128E